MRQNYLAEKELESIYFGGGTPSLLDEKEIQAIMQELSQHFTWKKNAEITLEANPDDIHTSHLKVWREMGINRLSIGLQSFNDRELKWMNRAHTAEQSVSSVKMAQDAGFENITIDLIYGSKFQDEKSWESTLQKAISLNTPHISSYNLTIESKTVLGLKQAKGLEPEVNEELSVSQFESLQRELQGAGFLQYEISNFAKEGYIARHNSNYWLQRPYLGIGPSAHSFNGNERQWNVKNNQVYIKALNEGSPYFEKEQLSSKDQYNEYVLTRLRTIWGCDLEEIADRYGIEYKDYFLKTLSVIQHHFKKNGSVFILKEESRFLADGIAADLFMD